MKIQGTDQLIEALSQELKPVNVLPHPLRRALPVFVVSLFYVAAVTAFMGLREDIAIRALEHRFVFELLISVCLAISAGLASFWLNVPDVRGQKWMTSVPLTIGAVGCLWAFSRFWAEGIDFSLEVEHLSSCILKAMLLGFVPAAGIVFTATYGATTQPRMLAVMHMLFVLGLGYFSLTLICSADDISHAFLYHLLPFAVFGGVLGLMARRIYDW